MGTVTTYEMTVTGRCPVDASLDEYELTIEAEGLMLSVEQIRRDVRRLLATPTFQETFTRNLRARLADRRANVRVTTVGWHSGVKTTCVSS